MAGSGTVTVNIIGNADKLKSTLNEVEGKLTSTFKSAGDKMKDVGKKMSTFVTLPILGAGVAAFKMASDMGESLSKVNVVFGESAKDITAWADTAAESLGMSEQEALEAAGTFGNLFRAMNIATPQAAEMSKEMIGLAGDLASFNNANPADVLAALKSGLVGETEPLRQFGVNLNAARIEAEALSIGLAKPPKNMADIETAALSLEKAQARVAKATKDHGAGSLEARDAMNAQEQAQARLTKELAGGEVKLDAGQKAQAAYSLIMKDTTLAQGDFERTAEGAANQQRILTAKFKDAATELGANLIPIGLKVLGWVTDLTDKFSGLDPKTQTIILAVAGLAAVLGPLVTVLGALSTVLLFIAANPIVLVIAAMVALAGYVYAAKQGWVELSEGAATAINAILFVVRGMVTVIFTQLQSIVEIAAHAFGWIPGIGDKIHDAKRAFYSFRDGVYEALGPVQSELQKTTEATERARAKFHELGLASSAVGFGGGGGGAYIVGGGPVRARASGGPVSAGRPYLVGEHGPELMVPGRAGTVVPNGAGGAISITVNGAVDPPSVARQIHGILLEYQRRSGALGLT